MIEGFIEKKVLATRKKTDTDNAEKNGPQNNSIKVKLGLRELRHKV